MVVLAASAISKSGKVLFSRTFVPIQRHRLESYLAAFPKLIGSNAQHTFIETENVRYVYQPIEQLYLVLITTKSSNIIEDLETLRLLAKVIPEYCDNYTEEAITAKAFDLIFAFDEVISLGYKENVTLQQVKTNTEMDSHEERLAKLIKESKENEAREEARRRAEAIGRLKEERRKLESLTAPFSSELRPFESSAGRIGNGLGGSNSPSSGGAGGLAISPESPIEEEDKKPKEKSSYKPVSGMQLGKKKQRDEFVKGMIQEEKLPPAAAVAPPPSAGAVLAPAQIAEQVSRKGVHASVEEKLTCSLEREGGIQNLEVSGELKLTIYQPDLAKVVVKTNGPLKGNIRCRLHPKIDTKSWSSNGSLELKDRGKGFPVGADNAPVILKWKIASKDESMLPFTVNFWPNPEEGRIAVNVQIEHQREGMVCKNVTISIPCPSAEPPDVTEHDGQFQIVGKQKMLVWTIPEISADNEKANLDFSVPEMDTEKFFPLKVDFNSNTVFSGLQVASIRKLDDGSVIDYSSESIVTIDKFGIE